MLELLKIRQECKDVIWKELHSVSLKASFIDYGMLHLSIFIVKCTITNRETGKATSFSFIIDKSLLDSAKLEKFKEYVVDCYHEATQKVLFRHEGTYKVA